MARVDPDALLRTYDLIATFWTDGLGETWEIIDVRETHGVIRVYMSHSDGREQSIRADLLPALNGPSVEAS